MMIPAMSFSNAPPPQYGYHPYQTETEKGLNYFTKAYQFGIIAMILSIIIGLLAFGWIFTADFESGLDDSTIALLAIVIVVALVS